MISTDFLNYFSELEDPRVTNHNSRHKFIDILTLGFIGTLCGCDDWVEVNEFCRSKIDFLKTIVELPNGIPSHDTFSRVFSMIDTYHFEELFIKWMQNIFVKTKGEIIALDGKNIRASREKGNRHGIHMVNAWACKNELILGSMRVDNKINEISTIYKLLNILNIANCTITIDAIGCQKKIAKKIIEKDANYILCVKNNQQELKSDIKLAFSILEGRSSNLITDSGELFEITHGRSESRRYFYIPLDEFTNISDNWMSAKTAVKVLRTRKTDAGTSSEEVYYISSHPYHASIIAEAIRKHWHVENRLHWQLDISFREDGCRSRIKNEAANLALMRRISMMFLKKDKKTKAGVRARRKKAGWDEIYLMEILKKGLEKEPTLICEKKLT